MGKDNDNKSANRTPAGWLGGSVTPVTGFSCKCEKCGSHNTMFRYDFNYGGYTGYDLTIDMHCADCGNTSELSDC